jgi:PleD family two-component response regulator
VPEVGILIIDDDIVSQRALKLILDSEGWRVRIVAQASQAMAELASGSWDLAIVNAALLDMRGPIFATLRELAQADVTAPQTSAAPPESVRPGKRFRILFLVPLMGSKDVPLILERDGLPYSFKPYHLHDFLQKVSDLLFESGAIAEPIRSMEGFERKKRRRDLRSPRDSHGGKKMFASREDYQMTEEELAEWERQEKEDDERKKRAKQLL